MRFFLISGFSCPDARDSIPCVVMAAIGIRSITQSWETVRYELLNTRFAIFSSKSKISSRAPHPTLLRELAVKRIDFQPEFYLTDSWGCPDKVPSSASLLPRGPEAPQAGGGADR